MPQTDISMFFNQVFFLILVFFILLTFFSKNYLKTLSINLHFRQLASLKFIDWNNFFFRYSSNNKIFSKMVLFELFFLSFSELSKINLYSQSLLSLFLSAQSNTTLSFNCFALAISNDYNLKSVFNAIEE